MNRKFYLLKLLALSSLLALVISGVSAQEPVTITWFVGLGTGTDAQQQEVQQQVVEEFNATHDDIELVLNVAASYDAGRDTLSTLIAAGTPPDIIGPVGVGGSNAYADQFLDLSPLVDAAGYDLSVYDPALVDLYRSGDALYGIPFAVFPVVTYYNRDLFDEAGLEYPPQEFDAPYVMPDGSEVPWNYDTVAEISKILTVDGNGNDATSADFDPENIVQMGVNFQFAAMRLIWTDLQPASLYDAENNEITFPDEWREATQWYYDRLWVDHTTPNATYGASEQFGAGNIFQSGNLGMAITPTWYTCCLGESVGNFEWDFAVVPQSFDGEYHVAVDADTFRIHEGTQHPEEAFEVLSYLLNDAAPQLTAVYGAFPANPAFTETWINSKSEQYDWGINWDVIDASLAYANPNELHHEANLPNWQQVNDRLQAFVTLLLSDTGADVDINAELDTVVADLQTIIETE
jgi:multiple sugar transport system substrate-binding protein